MNSSQPTSVRSGGLPASLRVLIIEDSEDDARLLHRKLELGGYTVVSRRVESAEAMRAALAQGQWDLVLCDYVIPGFGGPQALAIATELSVDAPFIVVSGKIEEDIAVEMLRAGASDFITKAHLERLLPAVKRELASAAAHRALRHAQAERQAAVGNSERRLRALMEHASDLIIVLDAQGTLRYCSPSLKTLGGYEVQEVLGKSFLEFVHPEESGQARRYFADILQAPGATVKTELRFRHRDGSWLALESIGNSALEDPAVEGIVVNARDVSERKRADAERRRLTWALRALSQSNSALVHATDEQQLFRSCCEAITAWGDYPLAWIGRAVDDPGHSVEIVSAAGPAMRYVDGFEPDWGDAPRGRWPAGAAIRTGEVQVVDARTASARFLPWLERARAHGLASVAALPIRLEQRVFGVLAVYSLEAGAFGSEELALLKELAGDIGYGIATRRTQRAYEAGLRERAEHALKLRAAMESAIRALAAMAEQRDPYTAGHQRRVAELAVAIGRELGLDEERLEGLRIASTIHDIGKMYVPAEILARPGRLSRAEFDIVKSHAQVGHDIIQQVDFPWPVAQTILQHHERLDGSGYPQGLKDTQIIQEARILAVADMVEAVSSHRPYRPGRGIDAALEQIGQEAGTKLDAEAVAACLRLFRDKGLRLPE